MGFIFSPFSSFLWELRPVTGTFLLSPVGVQCHKPSQVAASHRRWYVVLSFSLNSKSFLFPFPFFLSPRRWFFGKCVTWFPDVWGFFQRAFSVINFRLTPLWSENTRCVMWNSNRDLFYFPECGLS